MRRDARSMRILTVTGLLTLASGALPLSAAQQTATWLGGDGSWLDPAKWSGGVVPTNSGSDTYRVTIDGNAGMVSTVRLTSSSAFAFAIDSLTLNAGDTLTVRGTSNYPSPPAQYLQVNGPLEIDGRLDILSAQLLLAPGEMLGGTGTVTLEGLPSIRALSGPTLIGPGVTVRYHESVQYNDAYFQLGTALGVATQPLVNYGKIVNDRPGITLLGISGSTLTNHGTLEVRNGGYLVLDGDCTRAGLGTLVEDGGGFVIAPARTFDNGGNTLSLDSSQWVLQGTIRGGTLAGAARGLMVPYLDTGTLDGVTLNHAKIELSGSLKVLNGLAGTGTIVYGNPEAIEGSGNLEIPVIPPGVKIDGSPADLYLGYPWHAFKGVIKLAENQGTVRVARNNVFQTTGRTSLEGVSILNRGTFELSPDGLLNVQSALPGGPVALTFADGGKLVVDGGGLLKFAADLGTLDLSSALDQLIVRAKPDDSAYDMTMIVDGQLTLGVFNTVTPGITVTYADGDIFISGRPVPEPALFAAWAVALARRGRRR